MRSSGKLRVDRREQTVTRNVESVEEEQCLRATCRRTQAISDSRCESGESEGLANLNSAGNNTKFTSTQPTASTGHESLTETMSNGNGPLLRHCCRRAGLSLQVLS